ALSNGEGRGPVSGRLERYQCGCRRGARAGTGTRTHYRHRPLRRRRPLSLAPVRSIVAAPEGAAGSALAGVSPRPVLSDGHETAGNGYPLPSVYPDPEKEETWRVSDSTMSRSCGARSATPLAGGGAKWQSPRR